MDGILSEAMRQLGRLAILHTMRPAATDKKTTAARKASKQIPNSIDGGSQVPLAHSHVSASPSGEGLLPIAGRHGCCVVAAAPPMLSLR